MSDSGMSTFGQLNRRARLQLMRFVCSFAWADLEVRNAERNFVTKVMDRLDLSEEERKKVAAWLKVPPPPEEVDPALVPTEHGQIFIDVVSAMLLADGDFSEDEREQLELFKELLHPKAP